MPREGLTLGALSESEATRKHTANNNPSAAPLPLITSVHLDPTAHKQAHTAELVACRQQQRKAARVTYKETRVLRASRRTTRHLVCVKGKRLISFPKIHIQSNAQPPLMYHKKRSGVIHT